MRPHDDPRSQAAFSIVEVTLALGVVAFCFLAIVGLLVTGLNTNQAATQQTEATDILLAITTDLRSTPRTAIKSPRFDIPLATGKTFYSNGSGTPDIQANSKYRIAITLTPPPNGKRTATTGNILVTWPAQQDDPLKASGSIETFFALDRQ